MKAIEGAAGRADTNSTMYSGVTTGGLPSPPVAGIDVAHWNQLDAQGKTIPEFDIEYTADGTLALTNGRLLGGVPGDASGLANDAVDTVDFANNELDLTAHAYRTGDGPFQLTTTGTLPTGLSLLTNYWIIYVTSGTIQLATSRADALAGVAVSFSDAGSGTHTIETQATTESFTWLSHGKVGQAADGAISLTVDEGYAERYRHRPRVQAYALAGDISAQNLTVKVYVVQEI